jgi:hypothetical protein
VTTIRLIGESLFWKNEFRSSGGVGEASRLAGEGLPPKATLYSSNLGKAGRLTYGDLPTLQSGLEVGRLKWFGEVIVHSDRKALFAFTLHGVGGQSDEAQRGLPRARRIQTIFLLANPSSYFIAVHFRHLAVQENKLVRNPFENLQNLASVGHGIGPVVQSVKRLKWSWRPLAFTRFRKRCAQNGASPSVRAQASGLSECLCATLGKDGFGAISQSCRR